mgnify:FL=1
MTAKTILKKIMVSKCITNADLYKKLRINPATLWERLNSKRTDNMTVNKLNEMLKCLGFKTVIVPEEKTVSDGEYEVE